MNFRLLSQLLNANIFKNGDSNIIHCEKLISCVKPNHLNFNY